MARIEKSVEVNVPVAVAYHQMAQFSQFPRFMEGVQEVKQIDDTHLHWHSSSHGENREWDSEITEQVADRCIAWRNITGPKNSGRVVFESAAQEQTRITLTMDCQPDGDSQQAHLVESRIAERTERDLMRFKKMVEHPGAESDAWRGEAHAGQAAQPDAAARHDARHEASYASGASARSAGSEPWRPKMPGTWDEPLVVMRKVTREVDHLFEKFIGRPLGIPSWPLGAGRNWSPSVEVTHRGDQLTVCAELPGIKREDIHIEIKRDKLTIEGDRHAEINQQENEYRHTERAYGHFYREIPLPEGAETDEAAASMHDGVLEITVPVTPSKRHGRRIDIQSAQ